MLARAIEQELEAEADAEHGYARAKALGSQRVELQLANPANGPREGPDARQDDAVRRAHRLGIGGDRGVGADPLERLLDGAGLPTP